ncbi:MAG: hypothetical protein ACYCQK_07920 [Acidiferrobacteraceae bacterium]
MTEPTIARRLERRFILLTTDSAFQAEVESVTPPLWSMQPAADLGSLGDWNDILLYRFLVLDADDPGIDAVDVVTQLRTELMLQIPVFSFGGSPSLRDDLRLARADRFYDRSELTQILPRFFSQYAW